MTITDRWSLGYTLASTALMGALYGFINSVQQIVFDVFDAPKLLVLVFAVTASTMAVANFLNSRIVMVVGTRRISHSALVGLILLSGLHLVVALAGWETLATFAVIQRSEEHTSELQSLMRISYAVFCLKKKQT